VKRLLIVVAIAASASGESLTAHSGLRFSSPLDGSTLGAAPEHVQLTFVERPEPALASIRVIGANGDEFQMDRPSPVEGDPLSLAVRLRALPRGVYTVHWRVVSAVDGHASVGAFVFGVLMPPTPLTATDTAPPIGWLEIGARSLLLTGLALAIGSVTAVVLGFGAIRLGVIAAVSWLLATSGLVLLALAQGRAAQTDLPRLIETAVGRALLWRSLGVVGMLLGLIAIRATGPTSALRRAGAWLFGLSAIACVAVHAHAGHAAAGRWPVMSTVIIHSTHIVAASAWLGGLGVLALELRARHPISVRVLGRFSNLAAVALAITALSGIGRGLQEVDTWSALFTSAYGRLVLFKLVVLAILAALGASNRWRHVPRAAEDPAPLKRTAFSEAILATVATIAAGFLGALPPPASARTIPGLSAQGADFATTVRASFSALSDQPGPNRYSVRVEDYDSGRPLDAREVSLRFTPTDDPMIAPTTLPLSADGDGVFSGTGAQLAFPGRWRIEMLIQHGSTSSNIPIEVEAKGLPQFTSVLRPPNQAPTYTIESQGTFVLITVNPERAGSNNLQISFANLISEPLRVANAVVTLQTGDDSVTSLPIQRVEPHRFNTSATLKRGTSRIVVTARSETGNRIRAALSISTEK
jgi:copper transport protein